MTLQKQQKVRPTFLLEQQHKGAVCGIDEAGRGPLAGPVVACSVHIPANIRSRSFIKAINDSKKLSSQTREELYSHITTECVFGIGRASPEDIDTLNIHHATLLAMKRAWQNMLDFSDIRPDMVLIDGKFTPELPCACEAVKGGDSVSVSIAAASIIAKVTRDQIMEDLHQEYPFYGWNRNAGYGTAEHLAGIKKHGVTPCHRTSFRPVRKAL